MAVTMRVIRGMPTNLEGGLRSEMERISVMAVRSVQYEGFVRLSV